MARVPMRVTGGRAFPHCAPVVELPGMLAGRSSFWSLGVPDETHVGQQFADGAAERTSEGR